MKTKSSFVRSDCTVELYTITFVYLYVTLIIYPRNLEGDNSLRLYKTLQDTSFAVFLLVCVNNQF